MHKNIESEAQLSVDRKLQYGLKRYSSQIELYPERHYRGAYTVLSQIEGGMRKTPWHFITFN